jgi:hypothetical protein
VSVSYKSQPGNEFSHHVPHETIGGDVHNDKVARYSHARRKDRSDGRPPFLETEIVKIVYAVQKVRCLTHSVYIELPIAQNVLVFAQERIPSGIEREGHIRARPRPNLCRQMSINVTREG